MANIAQYNRRILVQRPSAAQDSIGQPVIAWVDVAPMWANIKMQTGIGVIRASADVSTVPVSIRVRYRTDADASMRAVIGSTIYAIKAVVQDEQGKEYTDLVCEVAK